MDFSNRGETENSYAIPLLSFEQRMAPFQNIRSSEVNPSFVSFVPYSLQNIDYLTIFRSNNVNIQFTEYTRANSICPRENCLDSTKCEHFVVGATCPRSSDTCCSIGKFVQNVIINEESWKYLFFVNRIHF